MQYGELMAIARMQELLGELEQSTVSLKQAWQLRNHLLRLLWHPGIAFLGTFKSPPPANASMPNSR